MSILKKAIKYIKLIFPYGKNKIKFIVYKFDFKKIKENSEIIIELNKYIRNTKMDAFIKISNAVDKNQKVEIKYKMPTCLRIIRFITKFETQSDIKIRFIFLLKVNNIY